MALSARSKEDAKRLIQSGADRVLQPFQNAADFAARLITEPAAAGVRGESVADRTASRGHREPG